MTRVSIRYENGTTVEANNLGDALVHLAHTGSDYVVDVVEQREKGLLVCQRCNGAGVDPEQPEQPVVLTRKQIDDKVAEVEEHAPRVDSNFEDRVKVARRLAKES